MAQNQSKSLLLNNLRKINRFAQMLRDDRFRQHRINSKKLYNRKRDKNEFKQEL
jgi:hypothetical protein